ncbi:MAG: FHA domain-containing protein [Anaerolineae bacterium]|nr:FHA domain-containing protein [Anaerolineae bacterium]
MIEEDVTLHGHLPTGQLELGIDIDDFLAVVNLGKHRNYAQQFQVVPNTMESFCEGVSWQIVLYPHLHNATALPLEIRGDSILGIKTPTSPEVDIDLAAWDVHQLGVSRKHLCLRPTAHKLYVFDLGSTNGTYVNGLPLGGSQAYGLRNGDVLTIGQLHITVSLVENTRPGLVS